MNNNANGNVLFLILIAVALFAALSYAVTQTSRGGTSIDKEQAGINAAQIVQYFSAIETAINKLQLVAGCTVGEISIQRDWNADGSIADAAADGYNASAAAGDTCDLFEPEGAGFIYRDLPEGTQSISAAHIIQGIETGAQDLVGALVGISQATCSEINRGLAIDDIPTDGDGVGGFALYDGSFPGSPSTIGDEDADLAAQRSACYLDSDDSQYIFYHLIVPR